MDAQELSAHIEHAIRSRWGTCYFRGWLNEEAKEHIVGLYAATGREDYVLLAETLYYAIESYIFFGDLDKIHVIDIVVFLESLNDQVKGFAYFSYLAASLPRNTIGAPECVNTFSNIYFVNGCHNSI